MKLIGVIFLAFRTRMPALFGICEHALQRGNFFFRSANWGNLREVHHEEIGLLWRQKSWLEVFSRCIRTSRLWTLSAASFWSVISFPYRFQRRWSLIMETAGAWGRAGRSSEIMHKRRRSAAVKIMSIFFKSRRFAPLSRFFITSPSPQQNNSTSRVYWQMSW